MSLFKEFTPQSFDLWKKSVDKELKGLSFDDTLLRKEEIEELEFSKFEPRTEASSGSHLNYMRASRSQSNDWQIGKVFEVKDERLANKQALIALNQGATSLNFVLQKKRISWSALFDNIGLDFISVQFQTLDEEQANELRDVFKTFSKKQLILLNDPLENALEIPKVNKQLSGTVQFNVNAFGVHQAGANATQEIVYALGLGHEYLTQLMSAGYTVDEASAMTRFTFGIGANYFLEAIKFRVFRKLWANIIDAYAPEENCSHACYIYAQTGFVNKSLKDPYTNLLRQTTEVMSAVLGGANEICVLPYDYFAREKEADLSDRMALNISNILKEESYFDKVIDPLGGSYNMEKLTITLQDKAWAAFQLLEKSGGLLSENSKKQLQDSISTTAKRRIAKITSGEKLLIGINKYPNPEKLDNAWLDLPSYFGLEALILEKHMA
jgi:methylmalonyl-CoA mutase